MSIKATILEASPVTLIVVIIAAFLCILRIFGVKGEFFQAIAHLFVGGLIAVYLDRLVIRRFFGDRCEVPSGSFFGWIALGMSVVEVLVFLSGIL